MLRILESLDWHLCMYLPYPLRLWWCRLWIRADEFHPSLSVDPIIDLPKEKRQRYVVDMYRRRKIAHRRTLL